MADLLVVCVTALLHVFSSSILSPRIRVLSSLQYSDSERRYIKEHARYSLIGNSVHSVFVGALSLFSVVTHWYHPHTLQFSPLVLTVIEISLTFFVTDLLTTVIRYPQSISENIDDVLHHVCGIVGLIIALYYGGLAIEMSAIRLLSQLSVPFLILRLLLLHYKKNDSLIYLLTFSSMIIVHFLCRIAIIPWYWTTYLLFLQTRDVSLAWIGFLSGISIFLDILNIYWLTCMLHTYYKYYPGRYNLYNIIHKYLYTR